jgi:hypothetical protein
VIEIDSQVNTIVQNIVTQITARVEAQVSAIIEQQVIEAVNKIDCTPLITALLNKKLDTKLNKMPISTASIEAELTARVDKSTTALTSMVQASAMSLTRDMVAAQVATLDINHLAQTTLAALLQQEHLAFPTASIPYTAIDFEVNGVISGNHISGGIIQNFGSVGIDDKATDCRLSIFDETTVVENNLVTKDLTVKGTTTLEGDLNILGTVPDTSPFFVKVVNSATNNVRTSLDGTVFAGYADLVFNKIKEAGIDLTQITVNGESILNRNMLGSFITSSNLQRVGTLQDLQVAGESFLSQTLYTSSKRVGINTIEPSQALSIWDQEIEVGVGKLSSGVAVIGTPRNQTLVLSSNGKNNITLTPDGATKVNQLAIGDVMISSSATPPANDQPRGAIVFNSSPSLGGPLGWVSLGDARWANFGIID